MLPNGDECIRSLLQSARHGDAWAIGCWDLGKQEVSVVDFSDRTLVCRDCGKPFTWTAGEQTFYAEKGLVNEPARCPECRAARKARLGLEPPRMMHTIVCAECGQETTVPFVPRNGRPVLCSSCFARAKVAEEIVVPMPEVAIAD